MLINKIVQQTLFATDLYIKKNKHVFKMYCGVGCSRRYQLFDIKKWICECQDVLQFWQRNSALGLFQYSVSLLISTFLHQPLQCRLNEWFSTTGLIANGKRSNLSADKLNRISLIHDNYDLIIHNI